VTVSHDALLLAVHGQADDVVSETLPAPPADDTLVEPAPSAYAQPDACATVNAIPPIVSVPVRAGPLFAAYE
jgi:hypothetical protein